MGGWWNGFPNIFYGFYGFYVVIICEARDLADVQGS
jgi:hypothetical protein